MTRRIRAEYDHDENDSVLWKTRREIPIDEWEGTWMGKDPVDMTGRRIEPGDWLVKTYQSGRSCNLEVRRVREVRPALPRKLREWETEADLNRTPRVYLGDSKVPVEYPGRCLIVGPGVSGFPWAGVV